MTPFGGRLRGRPPTGGRILLSTLVVLLALAAVAAAQETAPSQPAQPAPPPVIPAVRDIVVEGNRRIQAPAILNRVQTKIGDPLSPAALRDDVRSIFSLGFFDDVQVRTEEFEGGVRVIFAVVERPLLRESRFFLDDGRERHHLARREVELRRLRAPLSVEYPPELGDEREREIRRSHAARKAIGRGVEVPLQGLGLGVEIGHERALFERGADGAPLG